MGARRNFKKLNPLLLALLALLAAGCRNQYYTGSRLWTFVPAYMFDSKDPMGYPAEVLLPQTRFTTNRINLEINGEVESPGRLRVPENCSVLQAIGYAGGFSPYAHASRLYLSNSNSIKKTIRLHSLKKNGHRQVWYELELKPQEAESGKSLSESPADLVLRDGDRIQVNKAYW